MSTILKLSGSWNPQTEDECGPLRFERRCVDRWPVEGVATAICLGGGQFGRMHELRLLDYSDDGVGGVSDSPMAPGTIVSLGFQSPGYLAKRGRVLRCQPCGEGYRVAIQFEARMAA